jgi:hypothetical protein
MNLKHRFLNGFWTELEKDAEKIFSYTKKFEELDPKKKGKNTKRTNENNIDFEFNVTSKS